jgi:phage repressor protein C with HTH and peptisase S24 domain
MLSHKDVWNGIDQLAARNGLSASGLARRAGLDPTTFNKSKRITSEGKPRWPSTESVAKILAATKTSMAEFVGLMYGQPGVLTIGGPRLRSISWSRLVKEEGALDPAGFPQGESWEEIEIPLTDDRQAYVVELDDDVAAPVFRRGDLLVVSPSSSVRRGDRIVLRTRQGPVEIGILTRRTAQRLTLGNVLGSGPERGVPTSDIAWLGRIVWVSQ